MPRRLPERTVVAALHQSETAGRVVAYGGDLLLTQAAAVIPALTATGSTQPATPVGDAINLLNEPAYTEAASRGFVAILVVRPDCIARAAELPAFRSA